MTLGKCFEKKKYFRLKIHFVLFFTSRSSSKICIKASSDKTLPNLYSKPRKVECMISLAIKLEMLVSEDKTYMMKDIC